MTKLTERALNAGVTSGALGEKAAQSIADQRLLINKLQAQLAQSEREVREQQLFIERLKREIATLRSKPR